MERIAALTGLPHAYLDAGGYHQMGVTQLPKQADLRAFKRRLYEQFRIEIPCIEWDGRHWLRVSVQAYNSSEDINCLVAALGSLLNC